MATWCLTKQAEAKLLDELRKDGNPKKMANRTPDMRHAWFVERFGEENGTQLNALFESKLLLPNQQKAMQSFVKQLGGSKQIQRDFLSQVKNLKKALDKPAIFQFYKDYAKRKLGFGLSEEQFNKATEMAKTIDELKETANVDAIQKMGNKEAFDYIHNKDTGKANNEKLMRYGRAVIALDDYRTQLKQEAEKMTFKEQLRHPLELGKKIVSTALDTSKASKASMDDSALLNQGFPILANVLTINIWKNNAISSLKDMVKTIGGKEAWNEIRAYAVSRPNYINGMYKASKLAVMVTEEDFPTSITEAVLNLPQTLVGKITPENFKSGKVYKIFNALKAGKLYKASEVAFTGFQLKNRIDAFDLFLAISDKFNQKITRATVKDTGLGQLVNALTARGSLGKLEPVANIINAPFFSLRKMVGTIEGFFFYQAGKKTAYVRGLGIMARLQEILLVAVILGIAKMFNKDSVEEDPTSADYGKIKIGDTRFIIDQKAALTTLAMRIVMNKYKSSTTGNISEINTGKFGSATSMDLLGDFTQNKFSPPLGQFVEIINRQDRQGNKPTVKSVLIGLYAPLGIENAVETMNNPKAANLVATVIADFVGILANTYSGSNLNEQYIPEGAILDEKSLIDTVNAYAKVNKIDTEKAYSKLFAGQTIMSLGDGKFTIVKQGEIVKKVSGSKIIVERMSTEASTTAKKKAMGNTKAMTLDHLIPLSFGINNGGDNSPENQNFVPTSQAKSWTIVENRLGKAIKNGKISGKDAVNLILKLKKAYGTDSFKDIKNNILKKYQ